MSVFFISFLFLLSFASCSVIIPEELPSLLSVAYSNIPPIKKGNDHRVGFGFAFGNHADFQVLLELGPQTNTMNLTGQPFPTASGNTKRQAPLAPSKLNKNREKYYPSEAGNYLQNWAQKMKHQKPVHKPSQPQLEVPNLEDTVVELVKNNKGEYEIHQPNPGNMPKHVLDDLMRLYGQKKEEAVQMTIQNKRSEEDVKKITDDLSNVDLD